MQSGYSASKAQRVSKITPIKTDKKYIYVIIWKREEQVTKIYMLPGAEQNDYNFKPIKTSPNISILNTVQTIPHCEFEGLNFL